MPPRTSRRALLWSFLAGGLGTFSVRREEEAAAASDRGRESLVTPAAAEAIDRGLRWLASRQQRDGGFGGPHSYARNVGVCALCGTAFLGQGGLRGPYAAPTGGCTDYLLGRSQSSGFIVEEEIKTHGPMYGHGFATMYLGQVFGMDPRPAVWDALKRGAAYILAAQDDRGAWRYTPRPDDADVSVTTCQVMALFSARSAGIAIPPSAIQRSVAFLRECQNPDGGFRYRLSDPPESLFPRSAAAAVTLHAAGLRDDPAFRAAIRYLAVPSTTPSPDNAEYFYYGRFYGTHAHWLVGGEAWKSWFSRARDELLALQQRDGRWTDGNIGDEYATAMSLIVLQIPFNIVPVLSRADSP